MHLGRVRVRRILESSPRFTEGKSFDRFVQFCQTRLATEVAALLILAVVLNFQCRRGVIVLLVCRWEVVCPPYPPHPISMDAGSRHLSMESRRKSRQEVVEAGTSARKSLIVVVIGDHHAV